MRTKGRKRPGRYETASCKYCGIRIYYEPHTGNWIHTELTWGSDQILATNFNNGYYCTADRKTSARPDYMEDCPECHAWGWWDSRGTEGSRPSHLHAETCSRYAPQPPRVRRLPGKKTMKFGKQTRYCPNCGCELYDTLNGMTNVLQQLCSDRCREEWGIKYARGILGKDGMSNCICPVECDCQRPDPLPGQVRMVSKLCPTHNESPAPDPDCPVDGVHANGALDYGWIKIKDGFKLKKEPD